MIEETRRFEVAFAIFIAVCFFLVVCSCAGNQIYPTPEQMPVGRQICADMCYNVGRSYGEYRYDGKCVCK